MSATAVQSLCMLVLAAATMLTGSGIAQAAGSARVQEGDAQIELVGESGKQSELRTVRFNLVTVKGQPEPVLRLVPSHLVRQSPEGVTATRIDSSRVKIEVPAQVEQEPGRATFEISVTSLPIRCGTYLGTIAINVDDKKSDTLHVTLTVVPASSAALAMEPANITIALINGAGGFLAARPVRATRVVTVPALPDGASIAMASHTPLEPVMGPGEFPKRSLQIVPVAEYGANAFAINVDATGVAPGKYAGTGRFPIAGTDRWLTLPIEISVGTRPWWVLGWVFLGVVLGRFAKYMTDRGNRIVDLRQRYDRFIARFSTLSADIQRLLASRAEDLHRLVSGGDYDALETALAQEEQRVKLVVRAVEQLTVARNLHSKAEIDELERLLEALPVLQKLEQVASVLDDIDNRLQAGGTRAQQDEDEVNVPPQQQASRWLARIFVFLLPWGRTALSIITPLLLAFVGFETLYLNGPTTFGANPLTDYLSAIVWGLSADVAARTLGALGRTTPARV